MVKARGATKTAGSPNPTFDATFDGFVNGESET
jgi:hypothetical protein